MRGLLLGGTIIAALGALDDVTVTQAATVLELEPATVNFQPNNWPCRVKGRERTHCFNREYVAARLRRVEYPLAAALRSFRSISRSGGKL